MMVVKNDAAVENVELSKDMAEVMDKQILTKDGKKRGIGVLMSLLKQEHGVKVIIKK